MIKPCCKVTVAGAGQVVQAQFAGPLSPGSLPACDLLQKCCSCVRVSPALDEPSAEH